MNFTVCMSWEDRAMMEPGIGEWINLKRRVYPKIIK